MFTCFLSNFFRNWVLSSDCNISSFQNICNVFFFFLFSFFLVTSLFSSILKERSRKFTQYKKTTWHYNLIVLTDAKISSYSLLSTPHHLPSPAALHPAASLVSRICSSVWKTRGWERRPDRAHGGEWTNTLSFNLSGKSLSPALTGLNGAKAGFRFGKIYCK